MEDRCFEGVTHDIHDTDDVHTCTHTCTCHVCMYVCEASCKACDVHQEGKKCLTRSLIQ
jgi:hypothetical protein